MVNLINTIVEQPVTICDQFKTLNMKELIPVSNFENLILNLEELRLW